MVSPAIEAAEGWPFLVARGRRTGYRTLLAPAFLAAPHGPEILAESANGDGVRPGDVRRLDLGLSDAGSMTLWFTVEPLTSPELRDEHGRQLELLYGIVARGPLEGDVDDDDMRTARSEAHETFGRLLDGEEDFRIERCRPHRLRGARIVQQPTAVEEPRHVARAARWLSSRSPWSRCGWRGPPRNRNPT
jgi:hypothetical protein